MDFRWNDWNTEHLANHGVEPDEAEAVVRSAGPHYPLQRRGDDKWLVVGRGSGGRILQVVFAIDPDDQVYVIHARPLTDREKRRWRRRQT